MLRCPQRNSYAVLRKLHSGSFTSIRTITIPARATVNRRKRKIKNVSLNDLSLDGIRQADSKALEFKLKQLQEFTRNLREQMKNRHNPKNDTTKLQDNVDRTVTEDSEAIFKNLTSFSAASLPPSPGSDLSNIIMASGPLISKKLMPAALRERIDDDNLVLTALIDKSRRDWNGIISKLHDSELRLKDIPMGELKRFLLPKASKLSFGNIEKLDQMLLQRVDGDITKYTALMYECLFYNLSQLNPTHYGDAVTEKMKKLLTRFDKSVKMLSNATESPHMTQFILNACIRYSSKALSFENMNFFLAKFKSDYGIIPNRENYTTVIQFYTKMGLKKQAWDTFDTMKFLSKSHEPDVVAYESVLHLCNMDRDYAKAIDLYQEMIDKNLEPTVHTLSIMAKTLARASADPVVSENKFESLRLMGWKYIHEIEDRYRNNHKEMSSFRTLEAMMVLAAYDGDVGLARALYYKYTTQKYKQLMTRELGNRDTKKAWQFALDPQLFNYLLLAYSRYNSDSLPLLMGYEKGIKLRRNIMNSVDYSGRQDEDSGTGARLPMVPIIEVSEPWQIMSESRALWHFNLEYGGTTSLRKEPTDLTEEILRNMGSKASSFEDFRVNVLRMVAKWKSEIVNHTVFNPITLNSFLTIPIKMNDKKEFLLRLNTFCFQQHEFDSVLKQIYDNELAIASKDETGKLQTGTQIIQKESNLNDALSYITSMRHKLSTNCATYELMLKAAISFGDVELSTKTWKDRGEFRKSAAFTNLSWEERTNRDSVFATLMVDFFAKQGTFADALGIIMTSQRYIDWKFSMVKSLYKGLLKIEDEASVKLLLEIVNKKSPVSRIEKKIMELDF